MPKVNGLNSLERTLQGIIKKAKDANSQVVVGFSQKYALAVHENLDTYHPVGQAKYLEQPARLLQGELRRIIREVFKQTGSMRQALLIAGLRLQREAQELVPVDTSALKASAYTAEESEASAAFLQSFATSERIRLSVLAKRNSK